MRQLVLIRHGQTPWDDEGRIQGTLDIPLNNKGIKEADISFIILIFSGLILSGLLGSVFSFSWFYERGIPGKPRQPCCLGESRLWCRSRSAFQYCRSRSKFSNRLQIRWPTSSQQYRLAVQVS